MPGCFQSKPSDTQPPASGRATTAVAPEPQGTLPAKQVPQMSGPTVFVIYYSMYGHVFKMAKQAEAGLKASGVNVKLFQVPETLPEEVLGKMHAPPKQDVPIINPAQLAEADGFIFACPTRFGNLAAQFKTFWDSTGGLWMKGALDGKPFSMITSTANQGGGQGGGAGPEMNDNSFVHGGSAWGAGTFASGDGSRQPNTFELAQAEYLGKRFGGIVKKLAA